MSNYIGVNCPVCGKPFQEGDDIVVCPICGAPHHRACYQKKGSCAFVDQHSSGMEWQNPNQPAVEDHWKDPDRIYLSCCPQCGAANENDQPYCSVCGTYLQKDLSQEEEVPAQNEQPSQKDPFQIPNVPFSSYSMPYGGVSPEDMIDGIPVKEIAAYVGPNSHYYLPRFKAIAQGGNSWCWSAFFLNFIYYFYRKMYRVGALLLVAYILLSIPSLLWSLEYSKSVLENLGLLTGASANTQWMQTLMSYSDIAGIIRLGFSCFFALMAVRIYAKHVLSSIRKIRSKYDHPEGNAEYMLELSNSGRTSQKAVLILIGVLLAAEFLGTYLFLYFLVV